MDSKYGEYSKNQIHSIKLALRGAIFYLLLYVDPKTKGEYPGINVDDAFYNIQCRLGGLNKVLMEQVELVNVMSLLESAWMEYSKGDFDFMHYRKLILDAGSEIMKLREE